MQLNFFEHSRDTMLRNDVVAALERRDAVAARAAWCVFREEFALDETVPLLEILVRAVECRSAEPFPDHQALCDARRALISEIEPAALRILGARDGSAWLTPQWRVMAQRAARLPWRVDRSEDHAAPLWLRGGDWSAAIDAVTGIESWRRIPGPLGWMAEARYRESGLNGAWALFAELAWLSPERFDHLAKRIEDATLQRLLKRFGADFEGDGTAADLAWFAAWVLTQEPGLAPFLGQAQRSLWSQAGQGMRTVLELLGLERQGRHHEVVERRKALRDLNRSLFVSYMATR